MGLFLSQLVHKRCDTVNFNFQGKINELNTKPVSRAVLLGFLRQAGGEEVNIVNAPGFAQHLGLNVTESSEALSPDFAELIELTATGEGGSASVAGTFFGSTPRIVKINGAPH